ncbi:MAG: hypothetical protein ACLUGJ_06345 [Blautia wexlerae]
MKTLSDERRFTDIFIAIPENNAIKTVQHFPVFRALQELGSCIVSGIIRMGVKKTNMDYQSIVTLLWKWPDIGVCCFRSDGGR